DSVFDPYVDLLGVHISAETISLAHDEIHENHIGQILDLYNLLQSCVIVPSRRVFAVQLKRVWACYLAKLRRSCKSTGSLELAQMRITFFAGRIRLQRAVKLLPILSVKSRIVMGLIERS